MVTDHFNQCKTASVDSDETQHVMAADRTVLQVPGTPVAQHAVAVEQHAACALCATGQAEVERVLWILKPCWKERG